MTNKVQYHRHSYSDLRRIKQHWSFHEFFLVDALERYHELMGPAGFGRVLGVCNKPWEAQVLMRYPFSEIVLSGLVNHSEEVRRASSGDQRVSYQLQNAEALSFESGSFDLVYCKEGLHHLSHAWIL
jgi:hypothetical protein